MRRLAPALVLTTVLTAAPAGANPVQEADIAILRVVNQAHSPAADVAAGLFSNNLLLGAVPLGASFALTGGDWRGPVLVLESQLVSGIAAVGLKAATNRPRPYLTYPDVRTPHGPEVLSSWPSGHAAVSFAGATAVAFAHPNWAAPAYGWASLVSLSRVYNGIHYPSDIVSGAVIGVASAYVARWAFSGLNQQLGVTPGAAGAAPPVLIWQGQF